MAEPLPLCYLNGAYLPLTEARISPLDRGFLYADAVYEVMPVYGGRAFRFAAHGERLTRSLAGISMADPHTREEWRAILGTLIERNGGGDCYVYWQVDARRAAGPHARTAPTHPRTVFAFCAPLPVTGADVLERGVACVTAADSRWARCDIKSTALLANVLLRQLSVDAAAAETNPAARWGADRSLRFCRARGARGGLLMAAALAPHPARHHPRRGGRDGGPHRHTLPGVPISETQLRAATKCGFRPPPRGAAGDLPRRPSRRHG